jgi:hypothetical protein
MLSSSKAFETVLTFLSLSDIFITVPTILSSLEHFSTAYHKLFNNSPIIISLSKRFSQQKQQFVTAPTILAWAHYFITPTMLKMASVCT